MGLYIFTVYFCFMNKPGILLLFLYLLIPVQIYSQDQPVYNDTTYFIPFDEDFNLIMSASKGHMNNVINLLNRGAQINAITIDGISALMYAAENGDLKMVKLLVSKGASLDLKPWNGVTALISSCQLNHYSVAEFLITNNASVNLADEKGITPLHYAAAYNYADLLEMLIFYNADINKADKEGNTALITASYNNCPESVEILLQKGANPDQKDKQGYTPLMVATQENNPEIIDILLEYNADINLINNGGMTALGFAIEADNYELCEKYIDRGADINHKISNSRNLLELAKDGKEDEISDLLLTEGARPNYLPAFNKMTVGPGILFCSSEFMTGIDYGLTDNKYNTSINTGFFFRPSAIRVNTPSVNDTLYQYWERRFSIHMGLEKKFKIYSDNKNETGPVVGANGLFTFGGYRGSTEGPENELIFNPYAGWYYMNKVITLSFHYGYMNLDLPEFNNGRFKISLGFNISSTRKKFTRKNIGWLSE